MPTYDYECKSCEHAWETFQSIKAKPLRKCPECGRNTARRVIGPGAGILFKGSGFYITDYRSDAYKKAAAADTKPADKSKSEKSNSEKSNSEKSSAKSEPKSTTAASE